MVNQTRSAYLVLGYACNERCRCCPCKRGEDRREVFDHDEIKNTLKRISELNLDNVTLSGGEPTVSPYFFEVVKYLQDKKITVNLLSNGELLADETFLSKFLDSVKTEYFSLTTTLHSSIEKEHEFQNGTPGSFERSICGIKNLIKNGYRVQVKHCITKANYKETKDFMQFIISEFPQAHAYEFYGVDLCGITKKEAKDVFVLPSEEKAYIDDAIKLYETKRDKTKALFSISNVPFCGLSVEYWKYAVSWTNDGYVDIKDANNKLYLDSGPCSKNCDKCYFKRSCPGLYNTSFQYFGDDIVNPPIESEIMKNREKYYRVYNDTNLNKLYFSPYTEISLTPRGLLASNRVFNTDIKIKVNRKLLKLIMQGFKLGITAEDFEKEVKNISPYIDSDELLTDLISGGIVE